MSKRQKMSSQQVMKTLFETEDAISSEDENDFDDELSWYESELEMDALSDSNSKTEGSHTESEDKDDSVSQEVGGKDGYLWRTKPTNARRTPRRNIVTTSCILSNFLTKADAGTCQYAFDHANIFHFVVNFSEEKQKSSVFVHYARN